MQVNFLHLQDDIELTTMKKSCYGCPMFNICNGCRKTIKDYKEKDVNRNTLSKNEKNGIDILTANNFTLH